MSELLSDIDLHNKIVDLRYTLNSGDQDLLDSISDHIEAMKAKIEQQAAFLDSLATDRDGLQKRLDRVVEQHDKVAEENKKLHVTVDSHLTLRETLEARVKEANKYIADVNGQNDRLRKRNAKLAKKLERARI